MALLGSGPSTLLVALLDRLAATPADWIRSVLQQLPEGQACLPAEPPPEDDVGQAAQDRWEQQRQQFLEQLGSHDLMQPELRTERALQALELPAPVAAAALAQLPGPTCSPAQFQAAVQHPTVTRLLLESLLQGAADGSGPAVKCWQPDVFKAALCEAAWLGDLPLLDSFAASMPAVSRRAGQQMAAKHLGASDEQEVQWQLTQRVHMHELAHAALEAAARSGRFRALWLAAMSRGQAAPAAAQMLNENVFLFAYAAARRGELSALRALLQEAAVPLDACQLLVEAISGEQLPAIELVLSQCGMPANAEPALEAAIRYLQPAVLQQLVARGGLPPDVGRLLETAVKTGQLDVVEFLVEQGGPPAKPEQLLVCAVKAGPPQLVVALLTMLGPPANAQPPLMAAIEGHQPAVVQLLLEQCGLPADAQPLLTAAVASEQLPVVQLLLAGGLAPTAADLVAAIQVPSPACVRLLLAAADGPVEVPPPAETLDLTLGSRAAYQCPVLVTMQERVRTDRRVTSAGKLLLIMEALQAAGYRPTVYEHVWVQYGQQQPAQLVPRFDPIADDLRLDMQGINRFLWLAAQRPDWSPETHHRFMPRFKRTMRALLLAVHRSKQHGGGSETALARRMAALPNDLLLRIIGQAAYLLSAWSPGAQE